MISATTDNIHTSASDCQTTNEIVIPFPCWAGQRQTFPFRLVNDTATDITVALNARGQHSDRITFSMYQSFGFFPQIPVRVRNNGCSDTVWIAIDVENEATTEPVEVSIYGNIKIEYQAVSSWDNREDPATRYKGEMTQRFETTFSERGTVVTLLRYDPLVDKRTLNPNAATMSERNRCDIGKWVDPQDSDFWNGPVYGTDDPYDPYQPSQNVIKTKAFVGDRNIALPYPLTFGEPALDYSDTLRLLLPPSCYLHRLYCPWGSIQEFGEVLYQRTVYVLQLDGLKYSLENLKPRFMQKGEFAFWQADARLIFLPSGSNQNGWIPWNVLYPEGSDVPAHYITTFAASVESDYSLIYS